VRCNSRGTGHPRPKQDRTIERFALQISAHAAGLQTGRAHGIPSGPVPTVNGYALLRTIPPGSSDEDQVKAIDLVKKIGLSLVDFYSALDTCSIPHANSGARSLGCLCFHVNDVIGRTQMIRNTDSIELTLNWRYQGWVLKNSDTGKCLE
jgi:hypothetical protein